MKSGSAEVLRAVDEVIRSSASGQMHPGDTLGVWTFNRELYPGVMPLQDWKPEDKNEIASRTLEFLKKQRYGKESRLDAALDGMFAVIKNSDIITVFIISNGQSPMRGTSFDQQINALYAESIKEMKRGRKPIVTVLQAKRGKIIRYTVNALPWPVVIPEVPIAIKTAEIAANVAAPLRPVRCRAAKAPASGSLNQRRRQWSRKAGSSSGSAIRDSSCARRHEPGCHPYCLRSVVKPQVSPSAAPQPATATLHSGQPQHPPQPAPPVIAQNPVVPPIAPPPRRSGETRHPAAASTRAPASTQQSHCCHERNRRLTTARPFLPQPPNRRATPMRWRQPLPPQRSS